MNKGVEVTETSRKTREDKMNGWDQGSMGMLSDMMGGPAEGHPGLTFPSYPLAPLPLCFPSSG